ncbi:MAG TPA: DUF5995 family protein [Candidatus Dormibacteraeota bacterium]|jgi:hypothetical protein
MRQSKLLPVRTTVAPAGVRAADWQRVARLEPANAETWTVSDVIAALRSIRGWYRDLARTDERALNGVYWFNEFYVGVTEGVEREVRPHLALMDEPSAVFLRRLDVEFYERYRRALTSVGPGSAWRTLFRDCNREGRHPLQWAMEGIHAHIVGDLAPAVVKTLRDLGGRTEFPGPDSLEHRAFTRVNQALYRVAARMLRGPAAATGFPALANAVVPREIAHLVDGYIRILREEAWIQAGLLWNVWDSPDREEIVDGLGVHAAWYAREIADIVPIRRHLDFETVGGWLDLVLRDRGRRLGRAGRGVDRLLGGLRSALLRTPLPARS